MHKYGKQFSKAEYEDFVTKITTADDKRCKALGFNKADNIVDGRKPMNQLSEMGMRGQGLNPQEMFER